MTAQLIAFNLSDYIYLIIIVGFLLYFFGKKEKIQGPRCHDLWLRSAL